MILKEIIDRFEDQNPSFHSVIIGDGSINIEGLNLCNRESAKDSVLSYAVSNNYTDIVSKAKHAAKKIHEDPACGGVLRIKGFLQDGENWLELNATQHEISLKPIGAGQDVLIIIGEKLNEEKIRYYLE